MRFVQCSRSSLRRFISLYLKLKPTPYWYHQTLTFRECITDVRAAHILLNRFLDRVRKRFPDFLQIYVREYQERGAIHFHLLLISYRCHFQSAAGLMEVLGPELFRQWNEVVGGNLRWEANQLKIRRKSRFGLRYLLEEVRINPLKKSLRQLHWFGIRNSSQIHWSKQRVTKARVSALLRWVLQSRKLVPNAVPKWWTSSDIAYMKRYLEVTGSATDWGYLKEKEVGRKISDFDYLAHLNDSIRSSPNSRMKRKRKQHEPLETGL
jgi:hypothetical protein